jgi:hypothetical protein
VITRVTKSVDGMTTAQCPRAMDWPRRASRYYPPVEATVAARLMSAELMTDIAVGQTIHREWFLSMRIASFLALRLLSASTSTCTETATTSSTPATAIFSPTSRDQPLKVYSESPSASSSASVRASMIRRRAASESLAELLIPSASSNAVA